MRLTGRPLIDVCNVNDFVPATEVQCSRGDNLEFYFQLVDLEKNLAAHGWNPPGMRYMALPGATVAVTFLNLDSAKQFVRTATQPFTQDASVWKVSILPTDPLSGTVSLKFVLNEPGPSIHSGLMQAVLLVKGFQEIC